MINKINSRPSFGSIYLSQNDKETIINIQKELHEKDYLGNRMYRNDEDEILIIGYSLERENDIKKRINNIDRDSELVPDHSLKGVVDLRCLFEEYKITPKKVADYIKKGRLDSEKIRKSIKEYYLNTNYSDGPKKNSICKELLKQEVIKREDFPTHRKRKIKRGDISL